MHGQGLSLVLNLDDFNALSQSGDNSYLSHETPFLHGVIVKVEFVCL